MIHNRVPAADISAAFKNNGNYSPKNKELIDELANFISYYVQDNKCLTNQPPDDNFGSKLKDIMCRLSFVYTPLPILNMREKSLLVKNGIKMGTGSFGSVYSNVFDGNQIVTKIPPTGDSRQLDRMVFKCVVCQG